MIVRKSSSVLMYIKREFTIYLYLLNLLPIFIDLHTYNREQFLWLICVYFQATMTKRINKYTHMFISTYVVVWKLHFLLASTKWNEYMIFSKWYSTDDGKTCN